MVVLVISTNDWFATDDGIILVYEIDIMQLGTYLGPTHVICTSQIVSENCQILKLQI